MTRSLSSEISPSPPPDTLRLVLFGLPSSGKSALLGALAQAAQTQKDRFNGELLDRSGTLDRLQKQLYDHQRWVRAAQEIDPFLITWKSQGDEPIDALVVDCDGRVVDAILEQGEELLPSSPEGSLAREVVQADALLFVIDASAPPASVEADFQEFGRFLQLMQQRRGRDTEVAGLPVFVVLTKCDLLAQGGDAYSDWMDRIEKRKGEIDEHFKTFLSAEDDQEEEETTEEFADPFGLGGEQATKAFGRLALRIRATASGRPPLGATREKPREPFNVAELFTEALTEARSYRRRVKRSGQHLWALVFATGALVFIMLTMTAVLFATNRATQVAQLTARIEDFRFLEGNSVARRLRGPVEVLKEKQARLQAMRDDDVFDRVPPKLKDYVENRLEELALYIAYLEKIEAEPHPAGEDTERGLKVREYRLVKDLAPPRKEWADTQAARIRQQRIDEIKAIRRAIVRARDRFLDQAEEARRLINFVRYRDGKGPPNVNWAEWTASVEELLDWQLEIPENQPIPGAPTPLSFAVALRFDQVFDARRVWVNEKGKLSRLLNLCSALALATTTEKRPGVLAITGNISLPRAADRLKQLKSDYKDYKTAFTREAVPEAIAPEISRSARAYLKVLAVPAQNLVRDRYRKTNRKDSQNDRWDAVSTWLKSTTELDPWEELALVLIRLDDPKAPAPVEEMRDFLAKRSFSIRVTRLELTLSDSRGIKPIDTARLGIYHKSTTKPALTFKPDGVIHDEDRRTKTYRFRFVDNQSLTYRLGDTLWAELRLSGGQQLSWSISRTARWQFERLSRPPRLQRAGEKDATAGRTINEAILSVTPSNGVPPVPVLLPEMSKDD